MVSNKNLIFVMVGAILAGTIIAGVLHYENTYEFRQYSISIYSDLGQDAVKIAQDTIIEEDESNSFYPSSIKAQNIDDVVRLWVLLSGSQIYENHTLITNHQIKDGETSILLHEFVQPVVETGDNKDEKKPWKPSAAEWPVKYHTIAVQNSTINAYLDGIKIAQVVNPVIVEMSAQQNKKQVDMLNQLKFKNNPNLSYEENIIILPTFGNNLHTPSVSVEVVMDIEGTNAKVIGIIKHVVFNKEQEEYSLTKTTQEYKWYDEPKIIPISQDD